MKHKMTKREYANSGRPQPFELEIGDTIEIVPERICEWTLAHIPSASKKPYFAECGYFSQTAPLNYCQYCGGKIKEVRNG